MSDFSHDFLIDLATSLPDIREADIEPSTMSWGLNLDFLDEEPEDMSVSRGLNPDQLTLPPSPPAACHNVVVLPRNSQVAVLCGCRGNFLWELIPTEYCNFYMRPHLVNTVDHTVGTCKPLSPFTEALWEGYNICTRQILNNDHLTDYCLAVYQQHESSCFRNMTRYTVKSIKNILLFIENSKFQECRLHSAAVLPTPPIQTLPYFVSPAFNFIVR